MVNNRYQFRLLPLIVALAFVWALVFVGQLYAKGGEIQGRRVALIVGNSNYKSVYSLKNAVSDSTSIAAVLARLGFEVIEVSDVTKAEFSKALDKFSAAAQDAEAAVFYYSGHGFQLGGSNFLVPVDAKLNNRKTILSETLRLNDVIKAVQDRNRQTLIFLDACRNNPLPESVRDKSMIDGLAQLEAGTGTFVAFATQPGNITRDGAGDHSPFAAALIEHMETPGISISDMMIRVRNSVEVATLQTQTPWDQSSLRNQFYFSPEEEISADLTDEDKALLLSLPPALRKKFATQFGIRFSDDGEILTKTVEIKRRFRISSGASASASNGSSDKPEEPAVANLKPAIKGRFKIAAGDSSNPVVVASLEPKNKKPSKPILAPLDDELASNGAKFIPLPNFRPGKIQLDQDKDQLVAALSPRETRPELATRIEPESAAKIETRPAEKSKPEFRPESRPAKQTAVAKPAIPSKPTLVKPDIVTPDTVNPTASSNVGQSVPPIAKRTNTPVKTDKTTAPIVTDRASAPVIAGNSSVPEATKKPRIIAITNPGLAKPSGAKIEKDVQVALNSATRSIAPLKPASNRSSLRPVDTSAKRIVGKEVQTGQDAKQKAKNDVQVAALEPVAKAAVEPVVLKPEAKELLVAPVGLDDTTKGVKKDDVKVASLGTDNSSNNSRSDEAIAPAKEPSITPPSHAYEVQTELARLGCYRSKVDGLWGAKSARALFRYYGNKKVAPSELEPNAALLSLLRNDEVVVCKRTITKKRDPKFISKSSSSKSKVSKASRKKKGKRVRVRKSVSITKKSLKKKLSKGVFR